MTPRQQALMFFRYGLPVALLAMGVAGIIIGHAKRWQAGAGVVLLGVALMVWMINWLFRMSVESNSDRDKEDEAREYFTRTGHWPDEKP